MAQEPVDQEQVEEAAREAAAKLEELWERAPRPVRLVVALAPLAVAAAGVVAGLGLMAARRIRSRQLLESWADRLLVQPEESPPGPLLEFVEETLIGLEKPAVRRLLGAPHAAACAGEVVTAPNSRAVAHAQRWYYRLEAQEQSGRPAGALLIEFDRSSRAAEARFLLPPDLASRGEQPG